MKRTMHKPETKSFCYCKLNWENALVNLIGKGLFPNPSKALANTLPEFLMNNFIELFMGYVNGLQLVI